MPYFIITLKHRNIQHLTPQFRIAVGKKKMRFLQPYWYVQRIPCKKRWFGRLLLDVITSEFRTQSEKDHQVAFDKGCVYLERKGVKLDNDERIKDGDILVYNRHMHEPPVSSAPIPVVSKSDELIVVNKPSGLPVHPSGKFRYNSLTEIMGGKVYAANRIDRLTSGLVLLCTSTQSASKYSSMLQDRLVRKEYITKVKGDFPDFITCDWALYDVNTKLPYSVLKRHVENARESKTSFKKSSFDGEYSYVHCFPETGRIHQIRKHLSILGYPIANDELYNNQEFRLLATKIHNNDEDPEQEFINFCNLNVDKRDGKLTGEKCDECGVELFHDAEINGLYLHAFKYYALDGSWSYEAAEVPF